MLAQDIIIKPLLTEKGYDGIADKKYTFIVAKSCLLYTSDAADD